jgi:hypothetical protein
MMSCQYVDHKIGDLPRPSEGLDGRLGGATSAEIGDRELGIAGLPSKQRQKVNGVWLI